LSSLDESETWQGNQRYNLACFYALHNRPQQAIDLLEESFAKNSALIDWSKEDSDLDSLRELPRFQALYPQEA
jgi:adenylate cyclase